MIRTPAAVARDLARTTSEDDDVREAAEAQRVALEERIDKAGWQGLDHRGRVREVYEVSSLILALRCVDAGSSDFRGRFEYVTSPNCYQAARDRKFLDATHSVVLVDHGPGVVFLLQSLPVAVAVGRGPEAADSLMWLESPEDGVGSVEELVEIYTLHEAWERGAQAAVAEFWGARSRGGGPK